MSEYVMPPQRQEQEPQRQQNQHFKNAQNIFVNCFHQILSSTVIAMKGNGVTFPVKEGEFNKNFRLAFGDCRSANISR